MPSYLGKWVMQRHFLDCLDIFINETFIMLQFHPIFTIDMIYWVPQKLPQIYTVIAYICIGKVAWFAVYIFAVIYETCSNDTHPTSSASATLSNYKDDIYIAILTVMCAFCYFSKTLNTRFKSFTMPAPLRPQF